MAEFGWRKAAIECGIIIGPKTTQVEARTLVYETARNGNKEAIIKGGLFGHSLDNPRWLLKTALRNNLKVDPDKADQLLKLVKL
jgi:hypothetical protein